MTSMAAVYRPAAALELTLTLWYSHATQTPPGRIEFTTCVCTIRFCMTTPSAPDGIRFALEGTDEITFAKVLRDLMKDPAFARPLQVQAEPPRPQLPGLQPSGSVTGAALSGAVLTLVFRSEDRQTALDAMQRLKTILLRYGVQIDSIWTPES